MDSFICTTCGTQFPETRAPPDCCPICADERQFVLPSGPSWTTPAKLRRLSFTILRQEGELIGIGVAPAFIGQRALLAQTPHGNVIWDCVALLDPPRSP